MVTLTTLQLIGDIDPRRFRKDYGDPVKNERDFQLAIGRVNLIDVP